MKMLIVLLGLVLISECSSPPRLFPYKIIDPFPNSPDPCKEKTCPAGEECRLIRRCFIGENCATTCVPINTGDCRSRIHYFGHQKAACKSDGQCMEDEKCCGGGFDKSCITVYAKVEAPINPPPPPVNPLNPCESMKCPDSQMCSVYKPCGKDEQCDITGICTPRIIRAGPCPTGKSFLMKDGKYLKELTCGSHAQCPTNSHCNTMILDAVATCCLLNPERTIKAGSCPKPHIVNSDYLCMDRCQIDDDCVDDLKCCDTGCGKVCNKPRVSCEDKVCPEGDECRLSKECIKPEECNINAICVKKHTGICPLSSPFARCLPEACTKDVDCDIGEKCCMNGCSRQCIEVTPRVPAPETSPPPPNNPKNPCEGTTCPENQVCSVYKPCGKVDECNITAICTPKNIGLREGQCMFGLSLLMKDGCFLGEMFCGSDAECPTNSFCNMNILDLPSVCCIPEPAQCRKRFASRRSLRLRRFAAHANLMRRRHLSRRAARSTQ